MRLVFTWIFLLFAALVPATAVVMASTATPLLLPAKQALRMQQHQVKTPATYQAAKMKTHTVAGASASGKHAVVQDSQVDKHGDGCADCGPCPHCMSCSAGSSMVAVSNGTGFPKPLAELGVPERADPPAEFLSDGQDRPPRQA